MWAARARLYSQNTTHAVQYTESMTVYVAARDTQEMYLFHNNIAVSMCKLYFHLSTHGIRWVNLIGPSLPVCCVPCAKCC